MPETPPILEAPLDAYKTAAPNEPIWTVQGGDPLGGSLLRVWALFARIQAGAIPEQGVNFCFEQMLKAANNNPPENEREKDSLLLRATQTELISWDMDAYRQGRFTAEPEPNSSAKNSPNEKARLDLHDVRVRYAQKLSSWLSEMTEMRADLNQRGFLDEELSNTMQGTILALKTANSKIEPRRLMQQSG